MFFFKFFFVTSTPPSSEMLDLNRRWHLNDMSQEKLGFEKSPGVRSHNFAQRKNAQKVQNADWMNVIMLLCYVELNFFFLLLKYFASINTLKAFLFHKSLLFSFLESFLPKGVGVFKELQSTKMLIQSDKCALKVKISVNPNICS